MRIMILFFFVILLRQVLIAQQPTPQQIQEQKMQASREAKQMIADMEKEIAEARTRGEDPESIMEMEKQLATLKKMIGVLEKAGTAGGPRGRTIPPQKTVLPEYKSPILPLFLRQTPVIPKREQSKDTLLWYIGKKMDDSTLVTPEGMVVRASWRRNIAILRPDERRDSMLFILLNKVLSETGKMKNNYVVKMDGLMNSFFMYPQIYEAYREFDLQAGRYYDLASNAINLNMVSAEQIEKEMLYQRLVEMRDHLLTYMAGLPDITEESLLPMPERPSTICRCDSTDRMNFEALMSQWSGLLYKDELAIYSQIIDMISGMERYKEIGGTNVIPNWNATIFDARRMIVNRESQKLWGLIQKYEAEKNIYKEEALVNAAINFQSQLDKLVKITQDDQDLKTQGVERINRVKEILFKKKYFEKYIEQEKSQRNYNVLFDYGLYAAHEYNKKLFDENYDVPVNLYDTWIASLQKFNRFKFYIHMEFDVQQIDEEGEVLLTATGKLSSNEVIVRLGRYRCKWTLYPADVNHRRGGAGEEEYLVPVYVGGGTKVIYHPPPKGPEYFQYTGPSELKMVFPSIRIDFCEQAPDSIILNVLRYGEQAMKSRPNPNYGKEYSTDMLQYANKMFLSILKTKDNSSELTGIADRVFQMQDVNQVPHPTGSSLLDESQMEFNMNIQRNELQEETANLTHTANTVIPFDAKNGNAVLFQGPHSTEDPADKDAKAGIKLKVGVIRLSILHAPQ